MTGFWVLFLSTHFKRSVWWPLVYPHRQWQQLSWEETGHLGPFKGTLKAASAHWLVALFLLWAMGMSEWRKIVSEDV